MVENLKVNAKTEILEFKRKHNKLVGAVPKKDTDGNYKIFENIVDVQGHKRFIEGNGVINGERSDFTLNYAKWSLSGTHLMIVFVMSVANGETFTGGKPIKYEIPKWIYDKLETIWGNGYIENKSISYFADDFSQQNSQCVLQKLDNAIYIYFHTGTITMTKDRSMRVEFDLLVDNEEPETQD